MDSEKVKQLEARLRQMLDVKAPDAPNKPEEVRARPRSRKVIIRRRKGEQDKRIDLD
jgi:hypothetical protein